MALGAERGTTAGLATPTTPSAFPPTYLDNKHGPVQHSTYHAPYPPLAPASQPAVTPPLCAFFSDMFAWLWFDAVTLKSAPTPRFSQFISNVLTTSESDTCTAALSFFLSLPVVRRARASATQRPAGSALGFLQMQCHSGADQFNWRTQLKCRILSSFSPSCSSLDSRVEIQSIRCRGRNIELHASRSRSATRFSMTIRTLQRPGRTCRASNW